MKLREILDNNPIRFLDENNSYIGDQPLEKQEISFDVAHARPVGTYNGHEIWGSKFFGKDYDLFGILDKERNILAWCLFDIVKNAGYSTFLRAYVDKDHRGQNLTLVIMNFMTEKNKEKVMIDKDELTSSSSRGMIKSWFMNPAKRRFDIKFFDGDVQLNDPDIEQVLKAGEKNNISIVFEDMSGRISPRYGAGKQIIMDWEW